jgi:hypothetical protein
MLPRFVALVACAALLVWGASGCHRRVVRPIPKTYPATGKVVVTQGQFSAADCMIQFEPENPELMAQGIVAKDGTFSLNTVFHEDRLPGATEGPHAVRIIPPLTRGGANTIPVVTPASLKVEPKENVFTVKVTVGR